MTAPSSTFGGVSTATSATVTATLTAAAPAGALVMVAVNRSITGTDLATTATVADSAGNTWTPVAASTRATTNNTILFQCVVTNPIPAGGTVTCSWSTAYLSNRKALAGAVWDSGYGATLATSGVNYGDTDTSAGDNGSSTTGTTTTDTAAAGLLVAAFSGQSQRTLTGLSGLTEARSETTVTGTTDRGVHLMYRLSGAVQTQTASGTYSASSGWAACASVQESLAPPPAGGSSTLDSVVVGGVKRPVVGASVVVAGVKRPVVNAWVVVGGAKRPLP